MSKLGNKTLVVLASTYPRWANDRVPGFVQDFVNHISANFKHVQVIVPHYQGAARKEKHGSKVSITRFRYAYPYKFEDIAYGEFKKTRLYPIKASLYIASEFFTTFMVCIKSRPVVINAHWLIPQGFVAVLLKPILRTKVVISVHGADVFTLNSKAMRKVKRFVLKHADVVIVNSSATYKVCAGIYKRDYPIIPMGIDIDKFKLHSRKPKNKIYEALFVGRLAEEKGIMYLGEAMNILHSQSEQAHLTIVGDGPLKAEVGKYITTHHLQGSITMTGWLQQQDLVPYYEQADVFVGPSIEHTNGWREAFGVVFAEASAMGLPIIATNTGGIKDIVKHEVNGLIVPQKNAQAIANAISRLRQDPDLAIKFGKQGRDYVSSNLSWDTVITRYVNLFKQL